MDHQKAKSACLFFKLKPAIRKSVEEHAYHKTLTAFEEHFSELDARIDPEKGILAFHRLFLITGLALYRALHHEGRNQEELIGKIHAILWQGPVNKLIRFLAFCIRRSKDPFHRYLQILGPNNEWFFPCPPWEKVRVEIKDGIGWHQKKCPYADFFKKEGVVELTSAYCDMDKRIAALLPDHIELSRENTLCNGDAWCDFLYTRKKAEVSRLHGLNCPLQERPAVALLFVPPTFRRMQNGPLGDGDRRFATV